MNIIHNAEESRVGTYQPTELAMEIEDLRQDIVDKTGWPFDRRAATWFAAGVQQIWIDYQQNKDG